MAAPERSAANGITGSRARRRVDQIVLTPVRMQRGDAVRAKLAELELDEKDIADAVKWARQPPARAARKNRLVGSGNFMPTYKTSKARICVTVGMMTTGYDCTDILNIGLFRPIFSPTDFIQIKGRGTRKHDFRELLFDDALKEGVQQPIKTAFKLFDVFANCEYFEEEFNYDEVLKLPKLRKAAAVDRRLTLREILEKIFGLIPRFKSKDESLEEEFSKFVADRVPEPPSAIPAIKTYFKASVTSNRVRDIIDSRQFTDLATNPYFSTHDFRAVPQPYRTLVPEYVKDYVSLNQFAA